MGTWHLSQTRMQTKSERLVTHCTKRVQAVTFRCRVAHYFRGAPCLCREMKPCQSVVVYLFALIFVFCHLSCVQVFGLRMLLAVAHLCRCLRCALWRFFGIIGGCPRSMNHLMKRIRSRMTARRNWIISQVLPKSRSSNRPSKL